jgi:hypothetical protein
MFIVSVVVLPFVYSYLTPTVNKVFADAAPTVIVTFWLVLMLVWLTVTSELDGVNTAPDAPLGKLIAVATEPPDVGT